MSIPVSPHIGIVRVHAGNSNMWWFILVGSNIGVVVLSLSILARPLGGSFIPGLVFSVFLLLATNAVLVPLTILQVRKRLVLDFDRGIVTAHGKEHTSSDFQVFLQTARSWPGKANMLTLEFRNGIVQVQVDGFPPTRHTTLRDEALRAFVTQCLTAPEHFFELRNSGPMRAEHVIGQQEALAILGQR